MSTYEKVASVLLVALFVLVLALWFGGGRPEWFFGGHGTSDFDESTGQDFKIGPFATITYTRVSGKAEAGCDTLQSVIIAALHDIDKRLAAQAPALGVGGSWDTFEVNAATLELLCNTQATIELSDSKGNRVLLQKPPFSRMVPQGGTQADTGTLVVLDATVTLSGSSTPAQPQASASILIPDRFLTD